MATERFSHCRRAHVCATKSSPLTCTTSGCASATVRCTRDSSAERVLDAVSRDARVMVESLNHRHAIGAGRGDRFAEAGERCIRLEQRARIGERLVERVVELNDVHASRCRYRLVVLVTTSLQPRSSDRDNAGVPTRARLRGGVERSGPVVSPSRHAISASPERKPDCRFSCDVGGHRAHGAEPRNECRTSDRLNRACDCAPPQHDRLAPRCVQIHLASRIRERRHEADCRP